jgi:cell fate (sporulation/competence/biofilm development) regulator YlbF (YheA/YmcA/DUF963 family)
MSDLLNAQETPVILKTRELCASLLTQNSFQRIRAQLDAFAADDNAREMYEHLSELQSSLLSKQQEEGNLSDEEIQEFEEQRERLLLHPVAGGFVEAQQAFEELRDTISRYVTKTFELGRVPTAEEVEPKRGCCGGGGGGCGGGCSCS